MNAEDIRNVTFDKVMRGYRPEEVDAYLDQVAAELERLQTEKADAEKKMYILAEKVDQYRNDVHFFLHTSEEEPCIASFAKTISNA